MLVDDGKPRVDVEAVASGGASEPIAKRAARWKKAMRGGACGPLLVAAEVVDLIDHWDRYRAEADGMKCNDWLSAATGKGESFWRGRARGLELLGESARRTIHHEVVNYVARNVPAEFVTEVRDMLLRECRANNGHPLEYNPARQRIVKITGSHRPRVKVCRRCIKLEAVLREHGIEVPA